MKPQRSNPLFARFFRANTLASAVVVTLAGLAIQPAAFAANQTYQDASGLNTWNTTDANWDAGVVWTNNNSAIFGGTGEAVTVSAVTANGITFNSAGYNLTGGTITLGASSTITAAANASIGSAIAGGTFGLTKAGAGTLTLSGAHSYTGTFTLGGGGNAVFASGFSINNGALSFTGVSSTSKLTIESGATVSTKYIGLGDSGGSQSGRIDQTGGTVTMVSGGNGIRIGHWNSNASSASVYNLSGGTLDATGLSANGTTSRFVNVGWDGTGTMTVGGGGVAATLKAFGVQLDANGNGGGADGGNDTLTVSLNGVVEVGTGNISGAASGDRLILDNGTVKATAALGINSVVNANTGTTSSINANSFAVSIIGDWTGTGTVNLVDSTATTGSVIFNPTATHTVAAGLVTALPVSKINTGTTILGAATNLSGPISVTDGRLDISGTASGVVTVAGTKTLGGEGNLTNSLTMTNANLAVNPVTPGAIAINNPTFSGVNSVVFDTYPTAAQNPVVLFTYTGTLTGTLGTDLVLAGGAANYRSSVFNDVAGTVTVNIGTKALTWNGTSGGQWDIGTSSRWNGSEADKFYWGDAVTFDDAGVATNTIAITGELKPASITVTGNSKNYTITGGTGNFISGLTGLAKSGSSTLILSAPNTFTGPVSITGGTLQVGDGTNASATIGTGATAISSGATLSFFQNGSLTIANALSGAGSLYFIGTGASGVGHYDLNGDGSGFTGAVTINSGARVLLNSGNDVGTASGITVTTGGQAYVSAAIGRPFTISGNGWTESAGQLGAIRAQGITVSGTVALAANSRITSYGGNGTFSGVISESGGSRSLEIGPNASNTQIVTLSNANTYSGATTVNTNTRLSVTNTLRNTSGVTVNGTGIIDLSVNNIFTAGHGTAMANSRVLTADGGTILFSAGEARFGNVTLKNGATWTSNRALAGYDWLLANTDVGAATVTVTNTGGNTASSIMNGTGGIHLQGTQNFNVADVTNNANTDLTVSMILGAQGTQGGTVGGINKIGTGTMALSAVNTFTGPASVNGGTLSVTGASGTLNATSGVIIGGGGTLLLDNISSANNTDRLKNAGTVVMNGGTLNFSNTAGAGANYSETTGVLTIASGVNTIASSRAATGNTSTLTFASMVNSGGLVNFAGTNLGDADNRNKVLITAQSAGLIGVWATVNGSDLAAYDLTRGVIPYSGGFFDVTRTDSGTKIIPNDPALNVRIIEGTGTIVGDLTLTTTPNLISALINSGTAGTSTVALPSQILSLGNTGGILSEAGAGGLVIGGAVNQGSLTAGASVLNGPGTLSIVNHSANPITVNSAVTNNGTGVVTLGKMGTGDLILAATSGNTWSGTTTVSGGTLEVQTKSGDVPYVVAHGATLKIGYSTGGGYANTGMTLYGDGVSATTGFELAGGKAYNVSGGFVVNDAPTTIRQYGSGLATMNIFDIGSNPGLSISAAASGSVVDANIQFTAGGYGMVVTTAAGANTATGDLVMNGPLNVSTNGFYKRGTGSMLLNGTSGTTTSAINLQGGTLITGVNTALGVNAALNLSSGTKLIVNGTSQTVAGMSNAGTIVGGSGTLSTLTVSGTAAASSSGVIGGTGTNENNLALAKGGTSVLTLSGGANTYSGTTTVNGGTLRVTNTSGSATSSGAVTVNSSGTLDGSGTISGAVSVAAGGTITAGNAGVGNLTVGSLTFDGAASVNVLPGTTLINVTNALTASGAADSVTINIGALTLPTGTHHLISHSGSILGTGFAAFKVGTTPGGPYTYTLVDNAGFLDLQVTTSAIFWKGNLSSDWNTTEQNWQVAGSPVFYANTNAVVFDDTADISDVSIPAPGVTPGSVLFSNSTKDYTVTGSNGIAGTGSLTKAGTGYLTISTLNSFTGAVTINQGTLEVDTIADTGTNSALGAGSSIVLGGGKLVYWSNTDGTSDRAVAVNSPSTLEIGSAPATLTGLVSGTGALTKIGLGTLVLANTANSLSGAIAINDGAISVDDAAELGSGSITTASSGTLVFNPAAPATLARVVGGTGTLSKQGAETLNITTAGGTILPTALRVENGTLQISSGSFSGNRLTGSGLVTVDAGAALLLGSAHSLGGDNNGMSEALNIMGTLTVNGEQYVSSMTLDGGTINGTNEIRVPTGGNYSVAGSAPSTVAAKVNHGYSNATWNVSDVTGDAAADLTISGVMYNGYGFAKTGDGTMLLTGINTYTGSTTVNAGTLDLADNARLTFAIGATSGSNNSISGAGTVKLDGDFAINTSAASALTAGTWLLENVTTTPTYGTTFTVVNPDGSLWTDAGSNTWTKTEGAKIWTFDETSGILTLASGGYDSWVSSYTWPLGADTTRDGDPDTDGFSNLQEFLFGTNPTTSTGSLTSMTSDGSILTIRWSERTSGAAYQLLESATLANPWIPSGTTPSDDGLPAGDYQPRKAEVTIGAGKNFFRVEGVEN